jgi:hypothetical protein
MDKSPQQQQQQPLVVHRKSFQQDTVPLYREEPWEQEMMAEHNV